MNHHSMTPEKVLQTMNANAETGLSSSEVEERRQKYGYNRLKEKEQIMLDAIDNHVLEAMPTSNEDLEIIFSKFK